MAKSKPAIQVRAPKNADDFVTGKQPAASVQPSTLGHEVPAASVQPSTLGPEVPAASVQPSTPERQPRAGKSAAPKVRGLVQRADGAELARITVYLEPAVAMKLKRHCLENGLQVTDIAAKAVTTYVAKL